MAATVSGLASVSIQLTQTPPSTLVSGALQAIWNELVTLASGTGTGQVDKLVKGQATLATGANTSIDLTTVLDVAGAAAALAEVRLLMFKVTAPGASGVEIGPHAANGWLFLKAASDAIEGRDGGLYLFTWPTNGAPVVDGTHKVIYLLDLTGGCTVDYIIAGCSA